MNLATARHNELCDAQIRPAVLKAVGGRRSCEVVQELGVLHGANRIDIAVVGRGLHGFEIKSDRDSLVRFSAQVAAYSMVMERVTVVVGWRLVLEVMRTAPRWWGVMLAEYNSRGRVRVMDLRRPERNPSPDPLAIAQLLWRDEAMAILESRSAASGFRSRPRQDIYRRIVELVPDTGKLGTLVCSAIRRREGWRVGGP